jgi:hypothetical protein
MKTPHFHVEKKFRDRLNKSLRPFHAGGLNGLHLDSSDIESSLSRTVIKKDRLFLRRFDTNALYEMLTQIHLIPHLEGIGFSNIKIGIHADENDINYLNLYHKKIAPGNILLELRVSESKFLPDRKYFADGRQESYDMILIEWLIAQDPTRHFSYERPQLPGQSRPGLGILGYCFQLMQKIAGEIKKDGFLDIPDHIHGAIMYAKKFKFFDPAHEGILRALMRDLRGYSLSDISWGIITQSIIEVYRNEPQSYDPTEQVFCLSERLKNYFQSVYYKTVLHKYYKRQHYRFDYEKMLEKKKKILALKKIEEL